MEICGAEQKFRSILEIWTNLDPSSGIAKNYCRMHCGPRILQFSPNLMS